jgi:signal transduction histidine kinase
MLPLACVVGLAAAGLPAAWWYARVTQGARARAASWAELVAREVERDALRNPLVWRYRLDKSVPTSLAGAPSEELASVRVVGCAGEEYYARGARGEGEEARARLTVRGEHVGWAVARVRRAPDAQAGALWWAVGLGLGLGCVVFGFPVFVVRRQERELEEARRALEDANAGLRDRVEEAVGELRQTSARLVTIQDEERARLSRELHDGVGQTLTALKVELGRAVGGGEAGRLEEALELCDETMRELRVSVEDLRPMALQGARLEDVLAAACERFELRTGVAVYLRVEVERGLEPAQEAAALRVFQEAMHNVERHAGASEVGVVLRAGAGGVELSVEDDGVGFDAAAVEASGHGLENMRTRAVLLGGELTIEASPGEGARVALVLPV